MSISKSSNNNHHSNLLSGSLWLFWGNMMVQIGSSVTGIVNAHVLGPALLGVIKLINTIVNYASYSDLGLSATLARRVPIILGKGDYTEAENIRNLIFSGYLILNTFALITIWVLYFLGLDFKGTFTITILFFTSLIFIFGRLDYLYSKNAKAEGKFVFLGQRKLIVGLCSPIIMIPLVVYFELYGALIGLTINNFISWILIMRKQKILFRLTLKWQSILRLSSEGLQLSAILFQRRFLWGLEILLLSIFMNMPEVGLFGFALGALQIVERLPLAFNQVILRKMLVDRGKAGDIQNLNFLKSYFSAPYASYVMIGTIGSGVIYFLYNFIVNTILHQYKQSLDILKILILGYIFLKIRDFADMSFNVRDRLTFLIKLQGLFIIMNIFLDILLISRLGVIGAAIGSSVTYIFFGTLLVFLAIKDVTSKSWGFKMCLQMVTAAFLSILSLLAIDWLSSNLQPYYFNNFLTGWDWIRRIFMLGVQCTLYVFICIMIYSLIFLQQQLYYFLKRQMSLVWFELCAILKF